MDKIGQAFYTLPKTKEDFAKCRQPLSKEQVQVLVRSFVTVSIVAAIFETYKAQVYGWINEGKVKASKGPDGIWYIPLSQFSDIFGLEDNFVGQVPKPSENRRARRVKALPIAEWKQRQRQIPTDRKRAREYQDPYA